MIVAGPRNGFVSPLLDTKSQSISSGLSEAPPSASQSRDEDKRILHKYVNEDPKVKDEKPSGPVNKTTVSLGLGVFAALVMISAGHGLASLLAIVAGLYFAFK